MTEQCRLEVAAELQQRWEGIPHSSSHLTGNTSGRRNFSTPATEDWRITEYADRQRTGLRESPLGPQLGSGLRQVHGLCLVGSGPVWH